MNSYILFIYGDFEDIDDIQYFCNDVFGVIVNITDIKYIIQNFKNIIVIFTSKIDEKELIIEISEVLKIEQVSYYLMFELGSMVTYNIPDTLSEIMFKPIKLQKKNNILKSFDLDEILEKISKIGIDGISEDEKDFLDNYKF